MDEMAANATYSTTFRKFPSSRNHFIEVCNSQTEEETEMLGFVWGLMVKK